MQEKIEKPEYRQASMFFSKLAENIRNAGLKFRSQAEVFMLRRKILMWFKKVKSESGSEYMDRVEKQQAMLSTVFDAVKDIFKQEVPGEYRHKTERDYLLGKVQRFDTNPLHPNHSMNSLITFHNRLINSVEIPKLSFQERELADSGFKVLYKIPGYQISEVVEDKTLRRLAFRAINNDLPSNCLGLVILPGEKRNPKISYHGEDTYLNKLTSRFLTVQDENGKNLVAIELDINSKTTIQIEALKHINSGQVQVTDEVALPLLKLLAKLVKDGQLKVIDKIPDLEKLDVVITRSGEIKSKGEAKEADILFPTPILGEAINVEFVKSNSKTTPQEFLKSRDLNGGEAGIFQYNAAKEIDFNYENLSEENPSKYSYRTLQKYAKDEQITGRGRLDIQCGADESMTREQERYNQGKIWTMREIQSLMEKQMRFEDESFKKGPLDTNGNRNIFHVKGNDGKLRSFHCRWDSDYCEWNVDSALFRCEWLGGNRIFSRN